MRRVELNARFAVNPGDRRLEGRDHPGAVLGDGKAVTTTTLIQMLSRYGARNAVSVASISWEASSR
jgi:hypothetical protein